MSEIKNNNKLIENAIPINYNLKFEPISNFKFNCFEKIKINIKKLTNTIELNAIDLKIFNAKLIYKKIEYKIHIKHDINHEKIILTINKKISGNAEIVITFQGINNDKLIGFYKSEYDLNNKKKFILTSQFEPRDARRAFVCFDEPELKASFDVSFVIDKDLMAISNMPIETQQQLKKDKNLIQFKTTPKMSTYLLYLAVGKFDFVSTKYRNIEIRIITVEGKKKLTYFALECIKKILPYYENYFKIKYMLPKLDLIAIPDFSAGAMENWGAITFTEESILGNKNTSITDKQNIADTIAHEMTHQWFGDLVTMKWWDDLWLNESFASFMQSKCINVLFPEWEYHKEDVFTYKSAFNEDSFNSTHPIHTKVNSPNQINEIFDSITYEKGSCILSMLENFIGENNFRDGLRLYLMKFSYQNAIEDELWDVINYVYNKNSKQKVDVKSIAKYWINNKGFPLINITNQKNTIELEQKRFFLQDNKTNDKSIWPIPINYLIENKQKTFLFNNKHQKLETNRKWIKFNSDQKGFYKVKYDDENLEKLGNLIKNNKLNAIDSYGVEDDLFTLARTSKIKVEIYFDFINKYCVNLEQKYPLNINILFHLNFFYHISYKYQNSEFFNKVKDIFYKINKELFDQIKFNEKKSDETSIIKLRSILINNLGLLGDKQIINKANKLFNDLSKGKKINANIKLSILNIISFYGDKQTHNKLMKLYLHSVILQDKLKYLSVLSKTNNLNLLKDALNFTFSSDIRLQDKFYILFYSSTNLLMKNKEDLIINWIIIIAPMLAALAFSYAGFLYITSGGNESKKTEIHKIVTTTVLGLIVILAAWLIVNAILSGLNVTGDFNLLKKL
mgnify:CR=1 FL=1